MKGVLLLALLLVVPAFVAPTSSACASSAVGLDAVPCGKIYPTILVAAEGAPNQLALTRGATLDVPLTVTYRFDALNDGYSVVPPTDPVKISFEFPRKPLWADMKVEPKSFEVPVDNPTFFHPDPAASPPTTMFEYAQKVTVHVQLTGQAILRDGFDYAKLLVFAKSTETGLFQAGYGIKELRTVPEGALHESDVAGAKDHFTASPLPPLALTPVVRKFGGTSVTVTPPKDAKFWESEQWSVKVDPAPSGRMVVAVHDEAGNLVTIKGPLDAGAGATTLNVTLAKPGLQTVSVTLLPAVGSKTPPIAYALDFQAGDTTKAEGYQYDKVYVVDSNDVVPTPLGNTADATMQWERDVPFFAFDSAQAVSALLTLTTPGGDALARGLANIQFTLLDPDGNNIGQSSVDPSKPQWPLRVGSVPAEGWYTLRLKGVGLPALAAYDARVEVDYSQAPAERNHADGIADATAGTLARGGRNMTLPFANLSAWNAGDLTPALDHQTGATYALTVTDLAGTPMFGTPLRAGKIAFTPPAPGAFRAFAYADPALANAPFAPLVRAFTFNVGDGKPVVAQKFAIADAPDAPTTAPQQEALLSIYAIPVPTAGATGQGSVAGGRADVVDADGKKADTNAPGTVWLYAWASNVGPTMPTPVKYALDLPSAVEIQPLQGILPAAAKTSGGGARVPGVEFVLVLGAIAVLALSRRRQV